MKKTKLTAFIAAGAIALGSFSAVHGEDEITVTLNGAQIEFDVQPTIINDRTMVPMRMIFEAMGAEVEWDGDARSITAVNGDTVVFMTIDDTTMYVDDTAVVLDSAPTIIDDRTLVPARAVAESFGAEVDWDADTRTVIIVYAEDAAEDAEEPADATEEPAETTEEPADATEEPAEATEEPADATDEPAEATDEPTATAAATATTEAAEDCPIDYSGVITTSEVSAFTITAWELNDDGDYDITYTVRTFKEGSGSIEAIFNCLDASGKIIDTFGGTFKCTDYTWTNHTETETIDGDTVAIELKQ